jgi:hypothetical protein
MSAWELYEFGREAEKKGHLAQAYLLYSEAAALEPHNRTYWLRSQAVQSRAALEAMPVHLSASGDGWSQPRRRWRRRPPATWPMPEKRCPLPAWQATAWSAISICSGDSKQVYGDVAKAFGLDSVFDGDYQPTPLLHFRMENAAYHEALHGLELATGRLSCRFPPSCFWWRKTRRSSVTKRAGGGGDDSAARRWRAAGLHQPGARRTAGDGH